jgi:hypothetical protein
MADTLTYDPTEDNAPELNEEEQNSLEVGEKLAEQEEQLLAGKYKNAEELEKAYVELQQKLGSNEEETVEEEQTEEEDEPAGVSLINEASQEYYENDGQLSPETIEKFADLSSQDLVKAYLEVQKNNPQQPESIDDFTETSINSIKNSVGGETEYTNLMQWAADNLDDSAVQAFDSIVDSGSPEAVQIAVAGIKAEYDNTNGYEGRMLSGKAAASSSDVFRSQAEVVSAMNDVKYEKDPAYRQDVYEKLERSDLKY